MKQTAIVLTTINRPHLLRGYAENIIRYGHADGVQILMVADRKTPSAAAEDIKEVERSGVQAQLLDLEWQDQWLGRFPALSRMIPFDSDNRRNVGFLVAAERRAEVIITIDDDNFIGDGDFVGLHGIVGDMIEAPVLRSLNRWVNICRYVEFDSGVPVYPRGFPFSRRWADTSEGSSGTGRVMLNAGLWLDDPDVDAVTRLVLRTRGIRIHDGRWALGSGHFSPINTQNTAFHRDVLPAYYYVKMGASIGGLKLDRYGDIWSGFFAKSVIDHNNHMVTFGPPASVHRRNTHSLLKDLREELWGMVLTDVLCEFVETLQLRSRGYGETYLELADHLRTFVGRRKDIPDAARDHIMEVADVMGIWVETCRVLGVTA